MDWVWLDGKMVRKKDATIPCFEDGVLYGQGLFETMRCYQGRVFALQRHLRRLRQSCPIINMPAPSEKILKKAVRAVIKKNCLKDAYIRLNVAKASGGVHVFVFAKKLSLSSLAKYQKGFSAMLFKDEKIGVCVFNTLKSINHYFYIWLSRLAKTKGFDEALFLNTYGEVVEGSRTNIFIVKEDKVSTPALSCGCLPGVTRVMAIKLLQKLKIPIQERRIFPQELFQQDEIFITNSLIGIMPVTRLDSKSIGNAKVGAWTRKVMSAYKKLVERACLLR